MGLPFQFSYDGGSLTYTYLEGNIRFKEKAYTLIENMGPVAGGMWSNKETIYLRAPENEFEMWEPILNHIQASVQLNPQWIAQEIVNQEFLTKAFMNAQQAERARAQRALEIQRQLQEMDRQIVEHRQRTNAEIQNDAYLTLMEQEEYKNPFTGETEIGSNQWDYRWVTEGGEELYTDIEDYDPNVDPDMHLSGWERTPIRPRFPQ